MSGREPSNKSFSRIPDVRALPETPDYGAELFLRFVEDIVKRLTDKEWERVKKSRSEEGSGEAPLRSSRHEARNT